MGLQLGGKGGEETSVILFKKSDMLESNDDYFWVRPVD